jgi:hypothetical protein
MYEELGVTTEAEAFNLAGPSRLDFQYKLNVGYAKYAVQRCIAARTVSKAPAVMERSPIDYAAYTAFLHSADLSHDHLDRLKEYVSNTLYSIQSQSGLTPVIVLFPRDTPWIREGKTHDGMRDPNVYKDYLIHCIQRDLAAFAVSELGYSALELPVFSSSSGDPLTPLERATTLVEQFRSW